ncbi:IclR family transcriptional regulator [Micromonospora sp. WMMD812]|uniref:IclR family transcriptional regulator n=1 Tax=Micromonospora sp. WMMD812 TaxID=3015152 RepID=UPI00248AE460|nr:IclR family transcriptional regulator [Micromonospora sp. WMMD812]WBB69387.1 IclR family transcriptional regulator [Micromonospora sp. WMMD812]
MASDQGTNQSVEKAAAVLNAFLTGQPALRVSDVARHAGLGQSTASRLLATLETCDLVQRDQVSGLYQLGPALITMAGVALNNHPVHREARQRAQTLAAELGLGANVAIRSGATLFYLCNFEGTLAPRSFVLIGQHNPLHATGLGKCLLIGTDPEQRRALLPDLPAYTPSTITDHAALDAAVERATQRRYATEVEELARGRACVASPILDHTGTVCAALSVSGPLSAIALDTREAELSRMVIEVADAISTGLGYLGPADRVPARMQAVR